MNPEGERSEGRGGAASGAFSEHGENEGLIQQGKGGAEGVGTGAVGLYDGVD